MLHVPKGPDLDPEVARAMAELLRQTAQEPVSPRLQALVKQLEAALAEARQRRADN